MNSEFFHSRKLRYDIYVRIDGRWRLDSVVDDEREALGRPFGRLDYEETERLILGRANSLIVSGKIEAVRVVRERTRRDGFSTSREVYYNEASPSRAEAVSVGTIDGETPLCAAPEDLYRRDSCRIVGMLLRGFLDKLGVTPLELMHGAIHLRKLEESHMLLQGAVHQVATRQARGTGTDTQSRGAELHRLVQAVAARARRAVEVRLPAIEPGRFQPFLDQVEARFGTDARFYALLGITRHMQGVRSYHGRLETAVEWLGGEIGDRALGLIDEFVAGLLDSSALIMDLLGRQRNLAAALTALHDLADGRLVSHTGQGNAAVVDLNTAIGRRPMPATIDALWERIVRELERGRPLALNDPLQEWNTLMKLSDRLQADAPARYGDAVDKAVKARIERLRTAD